MVFADSTRNTPSGSAVWKEAVCTFKGGYCRHLLADIMSPEEIFVITMQPPALREIVKIAFSKEGPAEARTVEALVTDVCYRPADVRRCGFVATITSPENRFSYPPSPLLRSVDVCLVPATKQERIEKRRDPRIRTKVLDLEHHGALLGFDRDQIPSEMTLGILFRMDAYDAHGDVSLTVKGEIIRLIGVGRPTNAGVRFIDMDEDVKTDIENIIVGAIHFQNMTDVENAIEES